MVENGGVRGKCFTAGKYTVTKPCDLCKIATALLFCHKHSNFLCLACDSKLHDNTKHERVWLCEVCEQAPASVTCKADMAALCITCDKDIHSANPLASRHERIPVVPFYDSAEAVVNCTTSLASLIDPVSCYGTSELLTTSFEFPPVSLPAAVKSIDLYAADIPFFDFGFAIPTDVTLGNHLHDSVSDCAVPVQTQVVHHKSPYEIDLTRSVSSNSYNKSGSQSHSHSVCTSSIELGVVPEENSMLEISNPLIIPVNVGGTNVGPKARQFCAVDREARVLRYREKRKNRKFEKKIRYASRKAYAEKRPRIKGRFVKRSELRIELVVDRWLFNPEANINSYGAEVDQYGVIPSF